MVGEHPQRIDRDRDAGARTGSLARDATFVAGLIAEEEQFDPVVSALAPGDERLGRQVGERFER